MTFKKAQIEDLPKIVKLRLDLWKEVGKITSDDEYEHMRGINFEYFKENILKDSLVVYYFEESSNRDIISIGMGLIIEKPPINLKNRGLEGYVFNINTKPEYRKRGLAAKIINEIIIFFQEKGVKKASLISNEISYRLYEEIGFKDNRYYQEIIL